MKDVKLSKSNINADENCNELNFKNKIKDNNENCEKEKKEYNDISMNRLNVTCSDFSSSSSMDDDDDDDNNNNNNNNNVNMNNYNNYHCENRLNLFDNKTKMINGKKKEKKKNSVHGINYNVNKKNEDYYHKNNTNFVNDIMDEEYNKKRGKVYNLFSKEHYVYEHYKKKDILLSLWWKNLIDLYSDIIITNLCNNISNIEIINMNHQNNNIIKNTNFEYFNEGVLFFHNSKKTNNYKMSILRVITTDEVNKKNEKQFFHSSALKNNIIDDSFKKYYSKKYKNIPIIKRYNSMYLPYYTTNTDILYCNKQNMSTGVMSREAKFMHDGNVIVANKSINGKIYLYNIKNTINRINKMESIEAEGGVSTALDDDNYMNNDYYVEEQEEEEEEEEEEEGAEDNKEDFDNEESDEDEEGIDDEIERNKKYNNEENIGKDENNNSRDGRKRIDENSKTACFENNKKKERVLTFRKKKKTESGKEGNKSLIWNNSNNININVIQHNNNDDNNDDNDDDNNNDDNNNDNNYDNNNDNNNNDDNNNDNNNDDNNNSNNIKNSNNYYDHCDDNDTKRKSQKKKKIKLRYKEKKKEYHDFEEIKKKKKKIYDGQLLLELEGHNRTGKGLFFRENYLLSNGDDKNIFIYDINSKSVSSKINKYGDEHTNVSKIKPFISIKTNELYSNVRWLYDSLIIGSTYSGYFSLFDIRMKNNNVSRVNNSYTYTLNNNNSNNNRSGGIYNNFINYNMNKKISNMENNISTYENKKVDMYSIHKKITKYEISDIDKYNSQDNNLICLSSLNNIFIFDIRYINNNLPYKVLHDNSYNNYSINDTYFEPYQTSLYTGEGNSSNTNVNYFYDHSYNNFYNDDFFNSDTFIHSLFWCNIEGFNYIGSLNNKGIINIYDVNKSKQHCVFTYGCKYIKHFKYNPYKINNFLSVDKNNILHLFTLPDHIYKSDFDMYLNKYVKDE